MQILPFRLAFVWDGHGIPTFIENGWLNALESDSFETLLRFHIENEHKINPSCFLSRTKPDSFCLDDLPLLSAFDHQYQCRLDHRF